MTNNTDKKQPEQAKVNEEKIDKLLDKITPAEQRLLDKQAARLKDRHNAPRLKIDHKPGKPVNLGVQGESAAISTLALRDAFGTMSDDFQSRSILELLEAACRGNNSTTPFDEADVNGALAAMHGIAPRDETEGMLALQMVATHATAMRVLRQLKGSDNVKQQDSNGNLAIKLLRTYTTQIEALQRYRGKGQQKMTVEHVHVHAGGQAIVGNVTRPEGGGVLKKTEEQPHAKEITHEPMQEMLSPNKERQAMPIPRDA